MNHRSSASISDELAGAVLVTNCCDPEIFCPVARSLSVPITMHPFQYVTTLHFLRGTEIMQTSSMAFTRSKEMGHGFAQISCLTSHS